MQNHLRHLPIIVECGTDELLRVRLKLSGRKQITQAVKRRLLRGILVFMGGARAVQLINMIKTVAFAAFKHDRIGMVLI